MQRGRAYRRHQRRRAWRKQERYYREVLRWGSDGRDTTEEEILWQVRMSFKNRQRCSCWMCGNPRHAWPGRDSLTVQERREFELPDEWFMI